MGESSDYDHHSNAVDPQIEERVREMQTQVGTLGVLTTITLLLALLMVVLYILEMICGVRNGKATSPHLPTAVVIQPKDDEKEKDRRSRREAERDECRHNTNRHFPSRTKLIDLEVKKADQEKAEKEKLKQKLAQTKGEPAVVSMPIGAPPAYAEAKKDQILAAGPPIATGKVPEPPSSTGTESQSVIATARTPGTGTAGGQQTSKITPEVSATQDASTTLQSKTAATLSSQPVSQHQQPSQSQPSAPASTAPASTAPASTAPEDKTKQDTTKIIQGAAPSLPVPAKPPVIHTPKNTRGRVSRTRTPGAAIKTAGSARRRTGSGRTRTSAVMTTPKITAPMSSATKATAKQAASSAPKSLSSSISGQTAPSQGQSSQRTTEEIALIVTIVLMVYWLATLLIQRPFMTTSEELIVRRHRAAVQPFSRDRVISAESAAVDARLEPPPHAPRDYDRTKSNRILSSSDDRVPEPSSRSQGAGESQNAPVLNVVWEPAEIIEKTGSRTKRPTGELQLISSTPLYATRNVKGGAVHEPVLVNVYVEPCHAGDVCEERPINGAATLASTQPLTLLSGPHKSSGPGIVLTTTATRTTVSAPAPGYAKRITETFTQTKEVEKVPKVAEPPSSGSDAEDDGELSSDLITAVEVPLNALPWKKEFVEKYGLAQAGGTGGRQLQKEPVPPSAPSIVEKPTTDNTPRSATSTAKQTCKDLEGVDLHTARLPPSTRTSMPTQSCTISANSVTAPDKPSHRTSGSAIATAKSERSGGANTDSTIVPKNPSLHTLMSQNIATHAENKGKTPANFQASRSTSSQRRRTSVTKQPVTGLHSMSMRSSSSGSEAVSITGTVSSRKGATTKPSSDQARSQHNEGTRRDIQKEAWWEKTS